MGSKKNSAMQFCIKDPQLLEIPDFEEADTTQGHKAMKEMQK